MSSTGSSPLTRGKQFLRALPRGQHGLIPAHAGKTPDADYRPHRDEAHPRSRGENRRRCDATDITTGSSPLTRGKLPAKLAPVTSVGLIPAHAGKTSSSLWVAVRASAHPRSRGENVTS